MSSGGWNPIDDAARSIGAAFEEFVQPAVDLVAEVQQGLDELNRLVQETLLQTFHSLGIDIDDVSNELSTLSSDAVSLLTSLLTTVELLQGRIAELTVVRTQFEVVATLPLQQQMSIDSLQTSQRLIQGVHLTEDYVQLALTQLKSLINLLPDENLRQELLAIDPRFEAWLNNL